MKFRQVIATALCLSSVCLLSAQAQRISVSTEVIQDSVKQLGIMVGDNKGNMNLEKSVTRAEFAAMLVSASPYKNVTSNFGYTLFPDVPSTHWASGYVKVVVEKGYMLGQVDGTFAPDRPVLLEEAATAVLSLLGYTSETISGTYPQAQLAKFYELELEELTDKKVGETLTREDCMYIFYNALNTNTLNGGPYASQLGHAVTETGDLDTLALTNVNTQGPFMVGTNALPTTLENVSIIYKNDKLTETSVTSLARYDICYYNEKLSTVWIYDEKITGRLTHIDSVYAPTTITVAGVDYGLETTNVKYKFAVGGEFQEGDFVTIMLGQYGKVADVVDISETDSVFVGMVLESGTKEIPEGNDSTVISRYANIVTTDGNQVEIETSALYPAGRLVEVTYKDGVQSVRSVTDKTLSGKVDIIKKTIGTLSYAEDLEILEFSGSEYHTVYLDRIAGATLEKEDVRYYTTNNKGEITTIMLEDCTGDYVDYAFISNVDSIPVSMNTSKELYTYYLNGIEMKHYAEFKSLYGKKGVAYVTLEDYALTEIENLEELPVTSITSLRVVGDGNVQEIAENVQVYLKFKNDYQLSTLDKVKDLDKYDLVAYYDEDLFSAGGKVRVIVAEEKSE